MALWTYADWITLDGDARLTRLRLHIAEVSQRAVGTTTRGNGITAVDPAYLAGLQAEEQRLTDRRDVRAYARNRGQFTRE